MPPHMDARIDFHGMPACRLALDDGSQVIMALHGAQVLSWTPGGQAERIYLSPDADLSGQRPIRGGVPVIFPQFGALGPLPRHGFARNLAWHLEAIHSNSREGYASARFSLCDSPATREVWPYAFRAELTCCLSENRLDLELEICNTDHRAFAFTAALHTYLRVQEVEECQLTGLHGQPYTDQTHGRSARDTAPELTVEDEIDRLYHDLERPLLLREPGRALAIHMQGFPDAVIWNPWERKCADLDDMPPRGFRHMLCIEAAAITRPIELPPGQDWYGRQTLVCL